MRTLEKYFYNFTFSFIMFVELSIQVWDKCSSKKYYEYY